MWEWRTGALNTIWQAHCECASWPSEGAGNFVKGIRGFSRCMSFVRWAGEWTVEEMGVAYGGVAPKTIMARRVEAALKGRPLTQASLDAALAAVAEDVNITPNAPGLTLSIPGCLSECALMSPCICKGPVWGLKPGGGPVCKAAAHPAGKGFSSTFPGLVEAVVPTVKQAP